MGVKGVT